MKLNLLVLFVVLTQLLSAQTFTEVLPSPFEDVQSSSIDFADVDGDNDLDVLITGGAYANGSLYLVSKLYTNDGSGNYTEQTGTPFENVARSAIAFADVDGDNDQDVLITGERDQSSSFAPMSKLYLNDGLGNFTEKIGTPFDPVFLGAIAFSDIDGDSDQDVIITGQNYTHGYIAKLYTNDGLGNYTEVLGTNFPGVWWSSVTFSDIDGDNDPDLLITGDDNSDDLTKLYRNDGLGNFTEITGTPFVQISQGTGIFEDVDGDNDQDLILSGVGNNGGNVIYMKLYTNDGTGMFTEKTGTPFEDVYRSSVSFADIDGDNDKDVLINGQYLGTSIRIAKLYTNDGSGNFTEMTGTPFHGVSEGSVQFADVDGDTDQDVLLTGWFGNQGLSRLYLNNSIPSSTDTHESKDFAFTIFPNPTNSDWINIHSDAQGKDLLDIKIYDALGKLVLQHQEKAQIGEQNFPMDISSLNNGLYMVHLEDGIRKNVLRLIIQE